MIVPAQAQLRERDWFTERMDKRFHLRGRCWMSNGGGDEVVDYTSQISKSVGTVLSKIDVPVVKVVGKALSGAGEAVKYVKEVTPEDGHAKCIVKKRKRPNGAMRASGNVTVFMQTFSFAGTAGSTVAVTGASRVKTCRGNDRCTLIMRPSEELTPVGATACIEAKGKSRVVHVGLVPDVLKEQLISQGAKLNTTCANRSGWALPAAEVLRTSTQVIKPAVRLSTTPSVNPAILGAAAARNTCENAVQGKIAWDYNGSRSWNASNIQRLCAGAETSREPAACFEKVMHGGVDWGGGTKWQWKNAINLCEGTSSHRTTISCFTSKIGQGVAWSQAIQSCESR
ncbi:MAG: hypothetical protein AAFR21_07585 [Pseudomonadota bacterium]